MRAPLATRCLTCSSLAAIVAALALGACGSDGDHAPRGSQTLPKGKEPVKLDPADFSARIDNPYWPMAPGTRWTYREREEGTQRRVVVTVTDKTKNIEGITARVVHDVVTEGGELKEVTDDWYAQDSAGNVWYLGEGTKEYEDGKVSTTAGSWQHGVDGALAGVLMPARPKVGLSYRQEYYAGKAEDAARVVTLDGKAQVPVGRFDHTLKTEDFTPLEPVVEQKYFARGVGPVLEVGVRGGRGRQELVSFRRG